MYNTSETYDALFAQENHWFETRVSINGTYYGENKLMSVSTQYRVFADEQPAVGGCLSAELDVVLIAPSASIPRMAKVRPYIRVTDGTTTSEWIPQGVFYIDTRETSRNGSGLEVLTLHCYDDMLKAEAYYPSSTHNWPYSDIGVVREIAKAMGLQTSTSSNTGLDSRTVTLMNKNYQIGLPVGYSMRETLGNIAAMYAGNWIMNYDGKLRLVTLDELPQDTNYLVDHAYDAITFGGDRILV